PLVDFPGKRGGQTEKRAFWRIGQIVPTRRAAPWRDSECVDNADIVFMFADMSNSEQRPRRESISARLNPEVIQIIEAAAEAERRSVSSLLRNVVEDWARQQTEHAA